MARQQFIYICIKSIYIYIYIFITWPELLSYKICNSWIFLQMKYPSDVGYVESNIDSKYILYLIQI
jgi:hypothetical protein